MAFKKKYNVILKNVTERYNCLGLAGPLSRDVLSEVTTTDLSTENFPFLHTRKFTVAGVSVMGMRISYTGGNNRDMFTREFYILCQIHVLCMLSLSLGLV